MKPMIIDMKDMSDSTEVYESRPNPLLNVFIYLVAVMIVIAIIWMAFSRIDIVVRGTGTVAAADAVSTVTNQIAGIIQECSIVDGQLVKSGDILYVINHEDMDLQLDANVRQQSDYAGRIEALESYYAWISGEVDQFDIQVNNIYYDEFISRHDMLLLSKNSIISGYEGKMKSYDVKLSANEELIVYYEEAIKLSKQLIEAIRSQKNTFNSNDSYYYNKVVDYLAQCQNVAKKYDDQIAVIRREKEQAVQQIKKADDLMYIAKTEISEFQEQIKAAMIMKNNSLAVSSGDAIQITELQKLIEIKEIEIKSTLDLKDAQLAVISTCESSMEDYETQRKTALNAYEKETVSSIDSSIVGHQQSLLNYDSSRQEVDVNQQILSETGTENDIDNILTSEINTVIKELSSCQNNLADLKNEQKQIIKNLENATVKAVSNGIVNLKQSLVKGDFLSAGLEVLSIIPEVEESAFIVKSYIENKDIAGIKEGMNVSYEIAGFPSDEYGTIRGEVEFVSADLKVNGNDGSAYYAIETSIMEEEMHNWVGDKVSLKVGMLCQTKVVIEEKSILRFLLEKMKFFDS